MGVLDLIGNTPLVRLARIDRASAVPILAKCEHLNPGGSVKDRIAKAIIEDAEARGILSPPRTLIEATAGNTGVGLAIVGALKGYRVVCVMPEKMSLDKRIALSALGAEVMVVPNAPLTSPENFRNVAKRLAEERGWFSTDQFANPANPKVHEEETAREILEQTGGKIGAFVAGAGTGGTIVGVARRLKREAPKALIVLADPVGSALAQWVRNGDLGADLPFAVEGIGGSAPTAILDRTLIDEAEEVSDEESFEMTRRLVQEEGLLVGGSSGTAVVAALRIARRNDLDGPVVTLLPDGWDRYRSKPWMMEWAAESVKG